MLNCQRESSWWPLFLGGVEFDLWPTKHWSWRLVFQGNRPVLAIQTATIEGAHAASASDSAASSCRLSWSALGLNEPGLTAGPLDFHRGISKRKKKGTICQWWVFGFSIFMSISLDCKLKHQAWEYERIRNHQTRGTVIMMGQASNACSHMVGWSTQYKLGSSKFNFPTKSIPSTTST